MNVPGKARLYGTLLIGLLAVSCASLFVRIAQDARAPAMSIAAGRLVFASLIMAPLAWWTCRAELTRLPRIDHARAALIGAMLAAHFWFWIESLAHVSVALSTALACTTSLWVALGAWAFRGERLRPAQMLGLALALVGSIGLAFVDATGGDKPRAVWWGCALAVASAIAIAVNMLVGQGVRARLPVRAYAALAYGWAALWLLAGAWITGAPLLGLHPSAYLAMLALALVPQLIGHTTLNWALPFLGATTVAVSVLAEPVGAALIAALVLNEPISWPMGICFVVTLFGIGLVATQGAKSAPN